MLKSIIFICLEECCGDCVAVLFQKRNSSKDQRLVVVFALVFVLAPDYFSSACSSCSCASCYIYDMLLLLLLLIYSSLLFFVSTFSSLFSGITFSCFRAQSCEDCCEKSCEASCEECREECCECKYILGIFFRHYFFVLQGSKL